MRTNIPEFRLPEKVLSEETQVILDMGVDIRYNSPINSLKDLVNENYDAILRGRRAHRAAKDLRCPVDTTKWATPTSTLASTGSNLSPSST